MTVYVTGLVKSFGVVPLVWTAGPILTIAPVVVANDATRVARFGPKGMETATVLAA
jgi:hypothetical protein